MIIIFDYLQYPLFGGFNHYYMNKLGVNINYSTLNIIMTFIVPRSILLVELVVQI